jgi:SAM-dependent methyltransferase
MGEPRLNSLKDEAAMLANLLFLFRRKHSHLGRYWRKRPIDTVRAVAPVLIDDTAEITERIEKRISKVGRLKSESPRKDRDLKKMYESWVDGLKRSLPRDEAMHLAVGGTFELIGKIECDILRHYGLRADDYLIDVGCGSGRLAKPLSSYLKGPYLGFDLVADLIDYAREITARPEWRFEVIEHIGIPETDGRADMVCLFSVLTHLLHEQSYWYLEEAKRVLRPGGKIVFSFLEFDNPSHWHIFEDTVAAARQHAEQPLNVFIDRRGVEIWARHLGLQVVEIRNAGDLISTAGALGQSVCVLSRP